MCKEQRTKRVFASPYTCEAVYFRACLHNLGLAVAPVINSVGRGICVVDRRGKHQFL